MGEMLRCISLDSGVDDSMEGGIAVFLDTAAGTVDGYLVEEMGGSFIRWAFGWT